MSIISDLIKIYETIRGRKAKLELVQFTYEINNELVRGRGFTDISSNILLRNKSEKSTTIESMDIKLNGKLLKPNYGLHQQVDVPPNSSQPLYFKTMIKDEEFKKMIKEKNELSIELTHTYGTINESKVV